MKSGSSATCQVTRMKAMDLSCGLKSLWPSGTTARNLRVLVNSDWSSGRLGVMLRVSLILLEATASASLRRTGGASHGV